RPGTPGTVYAGLRSASQLSNAKDGVAPLFCDSVVSGIEVSGPISENSFQYHLDRPGRHPHDTDGFENDYQFRNVRDDNR
ncbi:MAG: hypothetical protein ABEN55_02410, partial [Bradymonadaceae bacterium]